LSLVIKLPWYPVSQDTCNTDGNCPESKVKVGAHKERERSVRGGGKIENINEILSGLLLAMFL